MNRLRGVAFAIGLAVAGSEVAAHDTLPGYLELRETGPETWEMLWKQPTRGELDRGLAPVFSPDCTVGPSSTHRPSPGALVARATIRCEFGLAGTTVEVSGLAAAQTDVLVRVYHADGRTETHLLTPSEASAAIGAASSGVARSLAHFRLGVEHILQGIDHLLFVLGLLLIVPGRWTLLKTITAFTVAHSITLAVATLGYAHAPALPLNASIALSILFLGPEIVRARRGGTSLTLRHPWIVAFAFGLLHGFGFASGLLSMGLPTGEIPLALLYFNLGVEAGQLAFVALILALERAFRVLEVRWPAWVAALPAYVVGSLGAYWTIERTALLLGSWR